MTTSQTSAHTAPHEPWLSPAERSAWLATAAIMISLPAALDARLQQQTGLSFVEYMVLAVLSENDDRTMQMSDIAAGVSVSLSRLSHIVTRLEKQGLVRRARIPGSGRRTTVTLTGDGYTTVAAAAPDHVRTVRELYIDTLEPDDLDRIHRIGVAVAKRVNPGRPFLHGSQSTSSRQ